MSRRELKDIARNTLRDEGDAVAGERIIAQARELSKPCVVPGTSTHKIQEIVLRKNALCVVDKPFKFREEPLRLKKK